MNNQSNQVDNLKVNMMKVSQGHQDFFMVYDFLKNLNVELTKYSVSEEVIESIAEIIKTKNPDVVQKAIFEEQLDNIIKNIKKANNLNIFIEHLAFSETPKNDFDIALDGFLKSQNKDRLFLLIGDTGVGKTYAIEQYFNANKLDIIKYACNKALDSYSLMWTLTDLGSGLMPHATPFQDAVRNGKVIFLDEFNSLPQDSKMLIQGITDKKQSIVVGNDIIPIHPNFKIIGALNPPSYTDERDPLGDAILGRAVGYIMEITDEILCERLNCGIEWIKSVRELYRFIVQTGSMVDVRELDFRDYYKFLNYGTELQMKFKFCMGDKANIMQYKKIEELFEYKDMIIKIKKLEKQNG